MNPSPRNQVRPRLEFLEDRCVPATLRVIASELHGIQRQDDYVEFMGGGSNRTPADRRVLTLDMTAAGTKATYEGGNVSSVQQSGTINANLISYKVEMNIDSYMTHQSRNIQQSYSASGFWTMVIDKSAGEEDGQRVKLQFTRGQTEHTSAAFSYTITSPDGNQSGAVTTNSAVIARIGDTVRFSFNDPGTGQSSTNKADNPPPLTRTVYLNKPTVESLPDPLEILDDGLFYDPRKGKVDLKYTVNELALDRATEARFEWLTASMVPMTESPISYSFPINTTGLRKVGPHIISLPFSNFDTRPEGAEFLRVRLDPDDKIRGDRNANNIAEALVAIPSLVANFMQFNTSLGELRFAYQFIVPTERAVSIRFEWMQGTTVKGIAYTAHPSYASRMAVGSITLDRVSLTSLVAPPAGTTHLCMTVDADNRLAPSIGRTTTQSLPNVTGDLTADKDNKASDHPLLGPYLQGVNLSVPFKAALRSADIGLTKLKLTAKFQFTGAGVNLTEVVGSRPSSNLWTATQNVGGAVLNQSMTARLFWGGVAIATATNALQFDTDGKVDLNIKAKVAGAWQDVNQVRYLTGKAPAVSPVFRVTLTGFTTWYSPVFKEITLAGKNYVVTPIVGIANTFQFTATDIQTRIAGLHNLTAQFLKIGNTRSAQTGTVAQHLRLTAVPPWLEGAVRSYTPATGQYALGIGWTRSLFSLLSTGVLPSGWQGVLSGLKTDLSLTTNITGNVPVLLTNPVKFTAGSARIMGTLLGKPAIDRTFSTANGKLKVVGSLIPETLALESLGVKLTNPTELASGSLFSRKLVIPLVKGTLYDTTLTFMLSMSGTVTLRELDLVAHNDGNSIVWDDTQSHVRVTAAPELTFKGTVNVSLLVGFVNPIGQAGAKFKLTLDLDARVSGLLLTPTLAPGLLTGRLGGSYFYGFRLLRNGQTIDEEVPNGIFDEIVLF